MIADQTIEGLEQRHAELDKLIRLEANRRVPDEDSMTAMKREKLAIKDHLTARAE